MKAEWPFSPVCLTLCRTCADHGLNISMFIRCYANLMCHYHMISGYSLLMSHFFSYQGMVRGKGIPVRQNLLEDCHIWMHLIPSRHTDQMKLRGWESGASWVRLKWWNQLSPESPMSNLMHDEMIFTLTAIVDGENMARVGVVLQGSSPFWPPILADIELTINKGPSIGPQARNLEFCAPKKTININNRETRSRT